MVLSLSLNERPVRKKDKKPTGDDAWEMVFEQKDDGPRRKRFSEQERTVLNQLLHERPSHD